MKLCSSSPSDLNPCPDFPDEVLEKILSLIDSDRDRNSASLVRKDWYEAERWTRSSLFVRNCFPVCPQMVARRFPRITRVKLQGSHEYSKFPLFCWDGSNDHLYPWLVMFAKVYPFLEELIVESMTVRDDSLELLAESFPSLKALSLASCHGYSYEGLKAIDSHCNDGFIIFREDSDRFSSIFGHQYRYSSHIAWVSPMWIFDVNNVDDHDGNELEEMQRLISVPKFKPKDPKAEWQKMQFVEMRRRERKLSKPIETRVQNSKKAMVRGSRGSSRGR